MSYIGRGTESISNVEVLDNLTFDGSASYTLQKSSTNFVPSSANNLLISISGVVQQGNFSVSGSTITFDTTVSASDTCDWILHYGTGLITTVADGAITEAKLGNNAVTSSKIDSSVALGKIGQVIQGTHSTAFIASGVTSYADTGLTATITPTSTSSKIFVMVCHQEGYSNVANSAGHIRLLRDGSQLKEIVTYQAEQAQAYLQSMMYNYLDSPSTTSAVTYKTQGKQTASSGDFRLMSNGLTHTITLMEVLA